MASTTHGQEMVKSGTPARTALARAPRGRTVSRAGDLDRIAQCGVVQASSGMGSLPPARPPHVGVAAGYQSYCTDWFIPDTRGEDGAAGRR